MTRRTAVKVAVGVLFLAAFVAIWFSPLRQHLNRNDIRAAVERVRDVWYGPLFFILAYAAGCVFALPASVFVVVAGFIWGWKLGGTYAMIGGVIGATAAYLIGRFVGGGLLDRFGKVGAVVKKQVDHAGFHSLLTVRFIPGLPFAAVNYAAGVGGVKLGDFLGATILGLAPSNYLFAYCADELFNGSMTEGDAFMRLVMVCAAMLVLTLLPVVVRRLTGVRPSPQQPAPGTQDR